MGSKSTFNHCQNVINDVDKAEAGHWPYTTPDQREWMRESRGLAKALAATTGYVKGGK